MAIETRINRLLSRLVSATVLAALATLAACGGGETTTGLTGSSSLDASAVSASATKLQSITAQPVLAAIAAQGSLGSITAFDRGVARIPTLVPRSLASAARLTPMRDMRDMRAPAQRAPSTPRSIIGTQIIPDSLLGKTLVPDLTGRYTVSAGTTGAPTNGVRFIIRSLGTSQNLGYADLTAATTASSAMLTLDVAPISGPVVLHDVETISGTTTDSTDNFVGYVTNGTDRVDYAATLTTVGSRTTSVATLSAPSASVAVADTSVLDGMMANDVSVVRLTVGSSVLRFTTGAVPDTEFGGYMDSDTTNVSLNGTPFARIVAPMDGTPSITAPNGAQLSAGDQAALVATEGVLLSAAMVLIAPTMVSLWLALATSGF